MFIKEEKKTMQTFLSCPRNEEEASRFGWNKYQAYPMTLKIVSTIHGAHAWEAKPIATVSEQTN
jgi:hypothetical protein